jgi:hypothetical protein
MFLLPQTLQYAQTPSHSSLSSIWNTVNSRRFKTSVHVTCSSLHNISEQYGQLAKCEWQGNSIAGWRKTDTGFLIMAETSGAYQWRSYSATFIADMWLLVPGYQAWCSMNQLFLKLVVCTQILKTISLGTVGNLNHIKEPRTYRVSYGAVLVSQEKNFTRIASV